MAQSSRGMMHLQYAHATCTLSLSDGKTFRSIDGGITPAITGDKTAAKRRVWHPVHGLVMFRLLVIRAASHSARLV